MSMENPVISTAFPYQIHRQDVFDSYMTYIEQGQGDPILFIHGLPTSSYVWRNVMPGIAAHGRCIALDLIGCGHSGKPDIQYTLQDFERFLAEFISRLGLSKITLVMHAWGGLIGLHYAMQHPEKIKGLVFFETQIHPIDSWDKVSLPIQQWVTMLQHEPQIFQKIQNTNYYIDHIFPSGILRRLTEEEMQHYREPFSDPRSRKPLLTWLSEVPLGDEANNTNAYIQEYSQWLQQSNLPKLMLYAEPGFLTTMEMVAWAKNNFPNLTIKPIGEDLHIPQETRPEEVTETICEWLMELPE